MKVFVPTIGSELVLSKACPVTIYSEQRNSAFLKAMGIKMDNSHISTRHENLTVENQSLVDKYHANISLKAVSITIPAGTILKVNRIYVRQGAEDFDSMTFFCVGGMNFPKGRFWLKLSDVNNFNIEEPKPIAAIQAERKVTCEENQKKKNMAVYNKVQRFLDKLEKNDKTIDELIAERVKILIDKNSDPCYKRFYSDRFLSCYKCFIQILHTLKVGEGDSSDRKVVTDFLYKLEHLDTNVNLF